MAIARRIWAIRLFRTICVATGTRFRSSKQTSLAVQAEASLHLMSPKQASERGCQLAKVPARCRQRNKLISLSQDEERTAVAKAADVDEGLTGPGLGVGTGDFARGDPH